MPAANPVSDETMDDEFSALADLMLDLGRELRIRTTLSPDITLTQTQSTVMRFVHGNQGCTPSEVASGTGLQRANVSAALRDLRRFDYVTTTQHEDDGRGVRINTTPTADANLQRLRARWVELLQEAWCGGDEPCDPSELSAAVSVLSHLAGSIARMPRS